MLNEEGDFYSKLPVFEQGFTDLFSDTANFVRVPGSWFIIITDIKNSTLAVQKGLHQDINLIATGSIIVGLNLAREAGIEIPFFFGGDGATLIVPGFMLDKIMGMLLLYRDNVKRNFDLDLRVDKVPVKKIFSEKKNLGIARLRLTEKHITPVVIGEGLLFADALIKAKEAKNAKPEENLVQPNLEGMECRWDLIKPSEADNEVICLLARVADPDNQHKVLKEVLEAIENIFGPYSKRRPVSIKGLKLLADYKRFGNEQKVKFGYSSSGNLAKRILSYPVSNFYLKLTESGKNYLDNLVELCDTLVIDGSINTVISGTPDQCKRIVEVLGSMEQANKLFYGYSVSSESIMSCYVQDRKDKHIHFVDGAEGGYTRAATMLKEKIFSSTKK